MNERLDTSKTLPFLKELYPLWLVWPTKLRETSNHHLFLHHRMTVDSGDAYDAIDDSDYDADEREATYHAMNVKCLL